MKRLSLTSTLGLLFLAILLPIVLFTAFLIYQLQENEYNALERRTLRQAKAIAIAIEPALNEMRTTLKLVSSNDDPKRGDLASFHETAKQALDGTGNFIILVDEEGEQLLNTRVAFGSVRGKMSDMDGLREAVERDDIFVSDVFQGRVSGKWVFNVMMPVEPSLLNPARALIITKNAESLATGIESLGLPKKWTAAVLDRNFRAVTSAGDKPVPTGSTVSLPAEISMAASQGLERLSLEADGSVRDSLLGFVGVDGTGWRVVVWGPVASAQASVLDTWRNLIVGGLVILVLGGAFFYLFTTQLRDTILGISRMARQVGDGEVVSPVSSRIAELDIIAKTLSTASFDRSESEDRVKMVVRELAHRTKNLMTVVLSMVRQTARRTTSVEQMKDSLVQRVSGLGYSIELLTDANWEGVQLRDLFERQLSTFSNNPSIRIEGQPIRLKAEAVQHLGMAIHELATNAVKYGALSVPGGKLNIFWEIVHREEEELLAIHWEERDGPAAQKPDKSGFGSEIVGRMVSHAFNGNADVDYSSSGLKWRLEAPLSAFVRDAQPATKPGV